MNVKMLKICMDIMNVYFIINNLLIRTAFDLAKYHNCYEAAEAINMQSQSVHKEFEKEYNKHKKQ